MSLALPPKALSVRQPWAWALIYAGKDIENRSAYAARFLKSIETQGICIHASKGMTREEYESAAAFIATIGIECPRPDQLTRGAIIGRVKITGVVTESDSKWFFGPCGLCVTDPEPVDHIHLPGALGYFNWQDMLMKRPDGVAAEKPLPWMKAWPGNQVTKKSNPQRDLI